MSIDYRPLRETDYDVLAAMFTDANIADDNPMQHEGEEIREEFESLPVDLEEHTISAWQGDQLVGATYAYHLRSDERQECCYVFGSVHPSFRGLGIGRHLLRQGLEIAERLLGESTSTVPKAIRAEVSHTNIPAMHLLDREGLQPVRYFADLHRPLGSISESVPCADFVVVPWDDARSEEIRMVKNLAFQDHWGSIPMSSERWRSHSTGFGSRLDLSFVALSHEGQIVGYLLSHRYESDDSLLGAKYAWVDNIGTLAEWRGRGVATQLLLSALKAYSDDGLEFAAINVDSDNPTGAYRLYESLGFRPWRRKVMYQREIVNL